MGEQIVGKRFLTVTVALLSVVLVSCGTGSGPDSSDTRPRIAVIPKGTTHVFWKSVQAGARKAGDELALNIVWKGPLKENDRAQQISIVEQFVSEGIQGIVLAPLDDRALIRPVRAAHRVEIPVVIIDSALQGEVGQDFVSFVSTDNKVGGQLAGHRMVEILGGKGKVVLLRYQVGSASTTNREEGFLEVISEYPDIELLVDNQFAGATAGEAIQKSQEMLDDLRRADGVFCPNESATYGMLVTMRKNNLVGHLKLVGFDSSEELLKALRKDEIQGLVVQNPFRMGYEGVRTVFEAMKGGPVAQRIDTGVAMVTRENLSDPDIRELVGE